MSQASAASQGSAPWQLWLERLRGGDLSARDELIGHACERLRRLTRAMLRGFPALKRWEDTDDVFQNAVLRLCEALQKVPPASAREFLGLAALQIRRELLDLTRHYYGPEGPGARHASHADRPGAPEPNPPDLTHEPSRLARLTELHQQVAALPEVEREVFDLLWYQELPQAEAAALLNVSVPTIKRRWLSARRRLHRLLTEEKPNGSL